MHLPHRPPGFRKQAKNTHRAPSREGTPINHGYFKSFDGTKLFYSVEGKGPPLIFCYGLVCSSLHWTYQIDHFRQGYRAVWFDYRGHQNSEIPSDMGSLTVSSMARDLVSLIDELGIEKPVVLGHSMGVNVALEFYRQQPHRVRALVLANGTAKRPLETLFHMNAFQTGFRLLKRLYEASPALVTGFWKMQKSNPVARSLVALGGFNPHLTAPEDIALYVDQVAESDPRILIELIHDYDRFDATSWLHTIQVPTLIIAGEKDKIVPIAQQELMHQLIPRSQLAVIRHGSHCPQMDLPELVNHRIEAFLREIEYLPEKAESG